MRKLTARFTAVLLLFLFLQKAGMRLWIHEQFHRDATINSSPLQENGTDGSHRSDPGKNTANKHFLPTGCDCVDDFFLPVTYTEGTIVEVPATPAVDLPAIRYRSFVPSSFHLIERHRGPPSFSRPA
ncbi:MAG: hypothetical protein P4L51_02565 [Puia sp.]|nr:hypothetical protein [Puia sp.]